MSTASGRLQDELMKGPKGSSCQIIIDKIGQRLGIENPPIKAITPEFNSFEELGPRQQFFRHNLVNYFEQKKGKQLSVLHGGNVLAPTPKVGWGHLIQINSEANDMANILGMNIFLMDPVDILSEKEKKPYSLIQEFLKVLHAGGDMNAFVNSIGSDAIEILDKVYYSAARALMRIAMTSRGFDEKDKTWLGMASKNIAERISHDPKLVGAVFQSFVTAEIVLTEMPFSRLFDKILPDINPAMILSAHSGTVRSIDRRIKVPALSAIPDDGYGPKPVKKSIFRPERSRHPYKEGGDVDYFDQGEMQLPFVPGANLFGRRKNMVYTVPTNELKDSMELLFNPDAPIVVAGTLSGSIEPVEFVDKWNQPERNILISSQGNAHSMPEILRIVREFVHAGPERTSGYRMVVFLGEHSDELVGKDLLEVLSQHPEIETVRTASKIETAMLKDRYTKEAHIQIRSGGENALDNGNMGCVPVCSLSKAQNETYNTIHSWRRHVAIPSSYPNETYAQWVEIIGQISDEERDVYLENNKPFDNVVDYLDYLFGEDQIARSTAISGFINSNSLSNLHILMLSTQLMLNKKDGRDDITKVEIEDIGLYMEDVKRNYKDFQMSVLRRAGLISE